MNIFTTTLMIVGLLGLNAFFVAAEFALISSRRDRISSLIDQGKPGAHKVLYATEHLSIMLAGCQFGITICSLILGKVAEPAVAHFIEVPFISLGVPENLIHPISFIIALSLITFLHILFGEMVPKNIAIAGPETLAMWLTPLLIAWVKLTRPLIEFMNWIARISLRLFGVEQKDELDSTVDQAQLATMIAESRSEGLLDAEESTRLHKALYSENRNLQEVLIPLEQVRTLDFGRSGPSMGDLEKAVTETGFSRFPVTGKDQSFLGYIHVKDVLDRLDSAPAEEIIPRDEIRPLIIVDGAGNLDEALHVMRARSAHMAQVRDKGELLGVITLEDLIEEYVGTVSDWTHEDTF
ncbi:Magnesium and cobalt efflux protein CorC [Corynebacterium occultum]|uniref:Magnesium and cobalt efflux protein CorC n=2 Tax=Corynebacterium occultum TaxID=2675219 RepID=A0A6B8VW17_9CORY|nr:hemolysin family protein [Corynebacterium occultum]QGU07329.1 Magnesium and cobalt efflux protein CorC [Corynebacterium occultum]